MNITRIVESKGFKNFMAKVYGWGASIVILGALFKIQHYPGAGIMLTIGLTTEAFIFFMSAFEPQMEHPDWSLVYPELAGITEEDIMNEEKISTRKTAIERFDELLAKAEIDGGLFEKLGNGLNNLQKTTGELADISGATTATQEYVSSIQQASTSFNTMVEEYNKTNEAINESAGSLANSYAMVADKVSQSGNQLSEVIARSGDELSQSVSNSGSQLAEIISRSGDQLSESFSSSSSLISDVIARTGEEFSSKVSGSSNQLAEIMSTSGQNLAGTYQRIADSFSATADAVESGNKSYADNLDKLTSNLSQLNTIHEMQLQESNNHLKASQELYSGMGNVMQEMKESVDGAKVYREQVVQLGQNLTALNTIYGNMLTAMSMGIRNPNNQEEA